MQPQKKPRNPFLDIIKGGLIILVVVGHLIQYNYPNFEDNVLYRFIYSFHMPLFILVSGYVAYLSNKPDSFFKKSRKKFMSLVIPFISWYFFYTYIFDGIFKTTQTSTYLKALVLAPDNGLWFLWILFLCYIVLFLIQEYIKFPQTLIRKDYLEYILFACAAIFFYLIHVEVLGIGLLKWHLPSFLAGYIIAKNIESIKKFIKPIKESTFILYPILAFFWYRQKDPSFIKYFLNLLQSNIWILITSFRYITAAAGSIFFIMLLKVIHNEKVDKMLEYLGKNTIGIYSIHYHLLGFVSFAGIVALGNNGISYIALTICTIIVISGSLVVSNYILKQSRILTFLFLGS